MTIDDGWSKGGERRGLARTTYEQDIYEALDRRDDEIERLQTGARPWTRDPCATCDDRPMTVWHSGKPKKAGTWFVGVLCSEPGKTRVIGIIDTWWHGSEIRWEAREPCCECAKGSGEIDWRHDWEYTEARLPK
jgi:hypothetical protein